MRIARWTRQHTVGEGFVIDDRVVPFGDGATVADMLAAGLDAERHLHFQARLARNTQFHQGLAVAVSAIQGAIVVRCIEV